MVNSKIDNLSEKSEALVNLYKELEKNYEKLPLATKVDDIVPGEGPADAKILFIGEAPGYYETVERRPFVGRSGKFFRKTLTEEAGIQGSEVYISNIVKVRPPENRDPTPEEIVAFKPVLDREIEIINPKLIITLGRFSMAKFLMNVKISQVHGRLHKVRWPVTKITNENLDKGVPESEANDKQVKEERDLFVLPMYHPAAGLRSGKMRESFIADFKKIPKIIEWIENQKETESFKSTVEEYLF
ncbi:uracil-DNA glycosylase [Patescibacteria group bacterium]|nr:uracil-DNA glycosylase [Patescibacteria group bacterium]